MTRKAGGLLYLRAVNLRLARRLSPLFGLALLCACDGAEGGHDEHKGHATPGVRAPDHGPAHAAAPTTEEAAGGAAAGAQAGGKPAPAEAPAAGIAQEFLGEPVATSTSPEGVVMDDYVVGEGDEAKEGWTVELNYSGYLEDGTQFDSSLKKGRRPFKFVLGRGGVIKGWDIGVRGMKVGGKRKLTVPAEQGYGKRGKGKIPADAQLTFTLELVSAKAPLPDAQPASAFKGKGISTTTTPSGLKITEYKLGEGAEAKKGMTVAVHYTGTLKDGGTQFDSSVPRKVPIRFPLGTGRVIKGWDEGIAGMKVGGLRKLEIPASLGYGDKDKGKIPPNSTLIFTVELMDVEETPLPPGR